MAVVFFSYSHKDEDLRDRLETHLAVLKRQKVIETWHDRRIVAGDEFAGRISEELDRADLILLLVSPDFLASDYCYDIEMARAVERHEENDARVIPIILRPCDWHDAPFGKLQAAPTDGKPVTSWPDLDAAFLDVVNAIRTALGNSAPAVEPTEPRSVRELETSPEQPRSSNLRVSKAFTDADKDRFLEEAFSYMCRFFEGSLEELKSRNPELDTAFKQIDANRFTAVIYQNGKAISRCRIVLGGMLGTGITYSMNDRGDDNSCNEQLRVEADAQGLSLKSLGFGRMSMTQQEDEHLTHEGAAEYYWSILMEPLQRG